MDVTPGYKQTEAGVIPDDWTAKQLGEIAAVFRGASPRPIDSPIWFDEVSVIGWVRISDVTRSSRRLVQTTQRLSPLGVQRSRYVPSGSLIMSIAATVGRPIVTGIDVCIHDGFVVFERPTVDQTFLYYMLTALEKSWARRGQTGSQMNLNTGIIKPTHIPLPPTQAEQEAIAEALGDADAFIESLEQLLAKKRQLKQGAMHQLLTGKKRLPGFSGEWEVVNLDGVVDRVTGVWGANDSSPDHPICTDIIRAGDISQDGLLTGSAQRFLSDPEFSKAHCRIDDIVITTSGNGLGKVWWCDGRPNVAASNFVRILRPLRGKSQGRYLSYVLRSEAGLQQLQEHTATSAYPNLRPSFFAAAWITLPRIPEQTAIAAILSDMDAEIAALEAKLAKARALKQGMMQELLSGKIRLV